MVRRGDICWLELPEEGRRPACVITRDEAISVLKNVVVATVSKTIRDIPSEIRLTEADGMPDECAISLDNLRTVPRALLTAPIATLRPNRIDVECLAEFGVSRLLS